MSKASMGEIPEDVVSSETLGAVFGALAHPARRKILISLHARGGVMTAGEIANRFKHSWPTTTRHLRVLKEAGIVDVGKRGRQRIYMLRLEPLVSSGNWVLSWSATPMIAPDGQRPDWTDLPFASMRNAMPPED